MFPIEREMVEYGDITEKTEKKNTEKKKNVDRKRISQIALSRVAPVMETSCVYVTAYAELSRFEYSNALTIVETRVDLLRRPEVISIITNSKSVIRRGTRRMNSLLSWLLMLQMLLRISLVECSPIMMMFTKSYPFVDWERCLAIV